MYLDTKKWLDRVVDLLCEPMEWKPVTSLSFLSTVLPYRALFFISSIFVSVLFISSIYVSVLLQEQHEQSALYPGK
jgi:hypothetical protein